MNVFFLCNKSPYPPREGGPLAINANIQSLLKGGHHVKVLALNTNKYFTDPNTIPEEYARKTGIEFAYVDLSIKPVDAFLNLFSTTSYHVDRFVSKNVENKIIEILQSEKFDIVQLEMLYMTPYIDVIKKYSGAKIVLRSHNVEHKIWERIAQTTKNPLKKAYISYLAKKLKNFELGHLNSYDGLITISQNDADFFSENGCTIPLREVPFGIDIKTYKATDHGVEYPSLFHIGSMNWVPNEEGIRWFIDKVWPLVKKRFPKVKLYLAGREMPDWLTNLNEENIEVLGEVQDAQEFIRSKAVMIVPLFSGSGIRIKIIEGMALGKAIISTKIGAEGIHYTDKGNILIANTPEEYLKAIEYCFSDRKVCEQLGKNARILIENEHILEIVQKRLESFYAEISG